MHCLQPGIRLDDASLSPRRNRPRRYTLIFRQDKLCWTGSPEALERILATMFPGAQGSCDASIFFTEGDGSDDIAVESLSASKQSSLADYISEMRRRNFSSAVIDLEQRVPYGSVTSGMPTLITHGGLARVCLSNPTQCDEVSHISLLRPQGHLKVQLFPTGHPITQRSKFLGGASASSATGSGGSGTWTSAHVKLAAGNTMHMLSIGPLMMYVMANLVRRTEATLAPALPHPEPEEERQRDQELPTHSILREVISVKGFTPKVCCCS